MLILLLEINKNISLSIKLEVLTVQKLADFDMLLSSRTCIVHPIWTFRMCSMCVWEGGLPNTPSLNRFIVLYNMIYV